MDLLDVSKCKYVGVDGCRYGWICVGLCDNNSGRVEYEIRLFRTFDRALAYYRCADLILVDIPIGLREDGDWRQCDHKAKGMLGHRSSSVFQAPSRSAAQQVAKEPCDHDAANRAAGRSISSFTFAIAAKVGEVDEVLRSRPEKRKPRVREVHPELCFWGLKGLGKPMEFSKKQEEGKRERIKLLRYNEMPVKEILCEARKRFHKGCVADDDILDALAAAATARIGGQDPNKLKSIPDDVHTDCEGLVMEMVYVENTGNTKCKE